MSSIKFPSMVVILNSLSTSFTLSKSLKKDGVVFNIGSIPYFPPKTPREKAINLTFRNFYRKLLNEAVETNHSIIMLNNSPLVLEVLNKLHEKPAAPNTADWLIVSYFHDDDSFYSNKVRATEYSYLDPQTFIEVRDKDLASLSPYPFIKKFAIPYNFQFTPTLIKSLFPVIDTAG